MRNFDPTIPPRVRELLDRRSGALNAETQGRLRQTRQQAVAQLERRRWWWPFAVHRWLTAGGLATAVVMTIVVSFWFASPQFGNQPGDPDELEIISNTEQLEIYEDLEFLRWLAKD